MEFRLLGPLEALSNGESLALGGPKQRAVLAMLLLHPNEVVPTDRVIDELWGERPPKSVDAYIQNCVSRLRAVLGRELIETRAPGYLLRVETDAIDALAFERALAAAEGLAAAERAAALREALALWRGPALADFAFEPFAQLEISRLDELRLTALERRLEAELDLGRHEAVLGEIEALARRHPSRERLRYLQMLALYRAGRQRDALRAYHEARLELVAEFGLEPGEELRLLERRIIAHDPALGLRPAGTDEQGAQPHRAAFVLRLELDAAAREETAAFLAEAAMIVERHGGHVRALTAEEVSAAFGPPVAHDDDALRALRAAVEIRAVAPATIAVRSAIERVPGGDDGRLERLLAQAASGDLILGQEALRVVPTAVDVVPHESGEGFRVLRFDPAAEPFVRHFDAPLVGRSGELAALEAALPQGPVSRRVVVVGEAGIGKTRLAREFVSRIEDDATVLTGRCAPYGHSVALRPLFMILDQVGPLEAALGGEPDAEVVAGRLRDRAFVERSEGFWAVRRLLESVAKEKPLVLVFEDVHWAAPAFLDLIEYLAGWAVARLTVLCLARPELLEVRPDWREDMIALQPIPRTDAEALVAALPEHGLLLPEIAVAAVEAGEGNPLFLEQLVRFAADHGEAALPPTLDVLIRSRIDRLPDEERAVLERASVAGRHFWRSTVEQAFEEDSRAGVGPALMALVRRRLVHPEQATRPGEDGFRFHHALIRDSVYAAIEPSLRGRLHELVARSLDARGPELDEVVGYHLEQAAHADPRLAHEAGTRLGRAGVRALRRIDGAAAVDLLTRALALVDEGRVDLTCALGTALKFSGDATAADAIFEDVVRQSVASANERVEHLARVERLWSQLAHGAVGPDEALEIVSRAQAIFEAAGDDFGLARSLHLEIAVRWVYRLQYEFEDLLPRLSALYGRADVAAGAGLFLPAVAAYRGPTPVPAAIDRCESLLAAMKTPVWKSFVLPVLAVLEAMTGRFDAARSHLEEARLGRSEFSDRGTIVTSWTALAGEVELLAGNPARSEQLLAASCAVLRAGGDPEWLATNTAFLAEAVYEQERNAEALALSAESLSIAPKGHLTSRAVALRVQARALARAGRTREARALAAEMIELLEATDALNERAAAFAAAAEVHALAGDAAPAEESWQKAIELFEQKGNVVLAERARRSRAALQIATGSP